MRKRLAALVMSFAALASAQAQSDAIPVESINAYIDRQLPVSGAPGLSYAVIYGDDTQARGIGQTRMGGDAVSSATLFPIGSVSKSITALATMQLQERGLLELDEPVSSYLDAFADQPAITLRQLLSHTSGFSTVQGNSAQASQALSLEAYAAELASQGPAQSPGIWQYSNANYQVLGAVIETVSGQDFAEYVREHIFAPAGMAASFVADGALPAEMATGHRPWFGGHRAYDTAWDGVLSAPAGGMVSNAEDMARYLRLMVNGQDDLISAEAKADMLRPASAQSPYYGLGWGFDPQSGHAQHTGLTPGFETIAILDPAGRRGVVVLVNASSGMGFGEVTPMIYDIATVVFGGTPEFAGAGWGRKSLYLFLALLPVSYVLASIAAWRLRKGLRAKTGLSGQFSLWFPLGMSVVLGGVLLGLVPHLFGTTLQGLQIFVPDLVLFLIAGVVMSAVWAILRLGLAHTGPRP